MIKQFKDIDKIVKEKKIELRYPKGYKSWKKKFLVAYKEKKTVIGALDKIHGEIK